MPGVASAGGTKPRAMARCRLGEKPPEVTLPTGLPSGSRISAPSRAGRAVDQQADADARRAVGEFVEDARRRRGNRRASRRRFGQREIEPGLDRRDGLVELVAVKRQRRLEPRLSRAPRPTGLTRSSAVSAVQTVSAFGGRTRISKPSSPV